MPKSARELANYRKQCANHRSRNRFNDALARKADEISERLRDESHYRFEAILADLQRCNHVH
jgi:hypothetical protein